MSQGALSIFFVFVDARPGFLPSGPGADARAEEGGCMQSHSKDVLLEAKGRSKGVCADAEAAGRRCSRRGGREAALLRAQRHTQRARAQAQLRPQKDGDSLSWTPRRRVSWTLGWTWGPCGAHTISRNEQIGMGLLY